MYIHLRHSQIVGSYENPRIRSNEHQSRTYFVAISGTQPGPPRGKRKDNEKRQSRGRVNNVTFRK